MISLKQLIHEEILSSEYELMYDGEIQDIIEESNEIIFPKRNQTGKCRIYIGQHGKDRMKERNVSEQEIFNAIFGAYKEISNKFKAGEIKQSRTGEDSRFVIIDARKNPHNPVSVSLFVSRSYKENKLEHPSFVIRTVYKGGDFSGATRHSNSRKGKEEVKIFLY